MTVLIGRLREAAETALLDRVDRQIDMRRPYVSAIEERTVAENRCDKTRRALLHPTIRLRPGGGSATKVLEIRNE